MFLDSAAAKALAAIILTSTQGAERLTPQLPLAVVDRGETWLVKGTPYTDALWQTEQNAFWIFLRKDTAEVVGIGFDASPTRSQDDIERLRRVLKPEEVARLLAPRERWEPGGSGFAMHMEVNRALYGGLVNRPADAVAYAHALMSGTPALAAIPEAALKAEERDAVWHVAISSRPGEVLSFSRLNGKVLSGRL